MQERQTLLSLVSKRSCFRAYKLTEITNGKGTKRDNPKPVKNKITFKKTIGYIKQRKKKTLKANKGPVKVRNEKDERLIILKITVKNLIGLNIYSD